MDYSRAVVTPLSLRGRRVVGSQKVESELMQTGHVLNRPMSGMAILHSLRSTSPPGWASYRKSRPGTPLFCREHSKEYRRATHSFSRPAPQYLDDKFATNGLDCLEA